EALPADVLHLDIADRLFAIEVIDGHGVGMVDLGHQLGFALEPLPPLGVVGVFGLDQLQGAFALEPDVPDAPDLAHAAFADLLHEPLLAEPALPLLEDRRRRRVPVAGPLLGSGVSLLGVVGPLAAGGPRVLDLGDLARG